MSSASKALTIFVDSGKNPVDIVSINWQHRTLRSSIGNIDKFEICHLNHLNHLNRNQTNSEKVGLLMNILRDP